MKYLFSAMIFFFSHLAASTLNWTSPVALSSAMTNASDPQIIMDPNGTTTVLWIESTYIKASTLPLNGAWSSPVTLSGASSSNPRLGTDSSGNLTAIWIEGTVVNTATMTAGSTTWSAPTALSSAGANAAEIAVRSNGDKVVIWERSAIIESITQLHGMAWGAVNGHSNANAAHPHIAIGDNGTVVAVWNVTSPYNVIISATKTVSGSWNGIIPIVNVGTAYDFDYPKVSVDPYGNADVIWFRYQVSNNNYINVSLLSASLPQGATNWTAIPTVFTVPGLGDPSSINTKIIHDLNGNAMALWAYTADNSNLTIETALKLFGKSWTVANPRLALYSYAADICPNSLGEAIGLFMNYDGSALSIVASECPVTGVVPYPNWSPLMTISSGTDNGYPKVSSAYLGGNLYAAGAWLHSDGTNTYIHVSTASKTVIAPPTQLAVVQNVNDFGIFKDYYNTLTWTASSAPHIQSYAIYRNGIFLQRVGSYISSFVDHILPSSPTDPIVYGVAAIDADGSQSEIATITHN